MISARVLLARLSFVQPSEHSVVQIGGGGGGATFRSQNAVFPLLATRILKILRVTSDPSNKLPIVFTEWENEAWLSRSNFSLGSPCILSGDETRILEEVTEQKI